MEANNVARKENRQPLGRLNAETYLWLMVAILLLAAALRLYALTADLPLHLSLCHGPTTDGANTVYWARNKALLGTWNHEGESVGGYYRYIGVTWLARCVFGLLGTGYWQANLLSVVAGLLAILFTASFAHEQFGKAAALLTALFMGVDFVYIMYNRTPMVYTPLTCGLALALYTWQRGIRRTVWFLVSGLALSVTILFLKALGLVLLPPLFLGLLVLTWRRHRARQGQLLSPLLLFVLGLIIGSALWLLARGMSLPSQGGGNVLNATVRTFEPSQGIEENVRFAVQSTLQFGVRSGVLLRMLPVFVLSYLYALFRATQALTKERPRLPLAEIVLLLFLLCAVLMLLASTYRPTRYYLVLIPPMCLLASRALTLWFRSSYLRLPLHISRLFPIFLFLGLTYFYYQMLASGVKLVALAHLQTGLTDPRVIADVPTLYTLLVAGMALGLVTTFFILRLLLQRPGGCLALPSQRARSWIALGFVVTIVVACVWQYLTWAWRPQFSIVEASRRIEQDLGQDAVLGGPDAPALALESRLQAVYFVYPQLSEEMQSTLGVTHLAMWRSSDFYKQMQEEHPAFMAKARIVKEYVLRGDIIRVYEIDK